MPASTVATALNERAGKADMKITQIPHRRKSAGHAMRWARGFAIWMPASILILLALIPPISTPLLGITKHVYYSTEYTPQEMGLNAEPITLVTDDDLQIKAWFAPSATVETKAVIIYVSEQEPSVTAYFAHAAWLAQEGYAAMPIELRAHGASEGDRIGLGITDILDVKAAVDYLNYRLPNVPIVAFGLSMGGATATNAFGEYKQISGLIALSTYTSWPDAFCQMMNDYFGVPRFLCTMEKPFMWLYTGLTYGFDKLSINPLNEIRKADGRPILLMQSLDDKKVAYENYEALSDAAPQAEAFLRDGNYHKILSDEQLTTPQDDAAYAGAILDYLEAHFGEKR